MPVCAVVRVRGVQFWSVLFMCSNADYNIVIPTFETQLWKYVHVFQSRLQYCDTNIWNSIVKECSCVPMQITILWYQHLKLNFESIFMCSNVVYNIVLPTFEIRLWKYVHQFQCSLQYCATNIWNSIVKVCSWVPVQFTILCYQHLKRDCENMFMCSNADYNIVLPTYETRLWKHFSV